MRPFPRVGAQVTVKERRPVEALAAEVAGQHLLGPAIAMVVLGLDISASDVGILAAGVIADRVGGDGVRIQTRIRRFSTRRSVWWMWEAGRKGQLVLQDTFLLAVVVVIVIITYVVVVIVHLGIVFAAGRQPGVKGGHGRRLRSILALTVDQR